MKNEAEELEVRELEEAREREEEEAETRKWLDFWEMS